MMKNADVTVAGLRMMDIISPMSRLVVVMGNIKEGMCTEASPSILVECV
jgi:hypothetical protein